MSKKFSSLLLVSSLVGAIAIISLSGCDKDGATDPAGAKGTDGTDGAAKCGTCHNVTTQILAKQVQWENSTHATGGHYQRNDTSCAICHTNEGFRERIVTGAFSTAAAIENPTPPNCRTCHNIHKDYAPSDFDISYSAPVKLAINGETVDFGKGNVCALCHQPRPVTPMPVLGGPDVEITSTRYGAHYGIQAATLGGTGYVEFPGDVAYENSSHTTVATNGCVTCHMAKPVGGNEIQAGGHTMNMAYDYNGTETFNVAACNTCHSGATNFDINGVQTEVASLIDQLGTELETAGITGEGLTPVKGTWSPLLAAAYLNYQMVVKDRSNGVHNPKYVKAILKNTIAALQ